MIVEMDDSDKLSRSAQYLGAISVAWIMLDSLLTYFANQWFGFLPPVNSLLIIIFFIILMTQGVHAILPPTYYFVVLVLGFCGFLAGKILAGQINIFSIGEVVLSFVAFFIAYFAFRWTSHVETYAKVFLYTSLIYVVVCVIALLALMPTVFPIVNAVWSDNGVPVLRPEITTDQNFQIFYLFPIVLVLALPFKFVRSMIAIFGMVGALFVLAKIQTRSGFIVFCGVSFMVLMVPLLTKNLGRAKTVILPVLLLVVLILNHDVIIQVGDHLIARFTEKSGAGLGSEMGQDRLDSSLFSIQHILDPEWWVPRGSQEFINRYGFLPHSTMTAVYLEGGIVGLFMWLTVFIFPLMALGFLLLKRKLDALATLVLIGGVASFAIQMSLHVPFLKHTWLWAGAVLGSFIRVSSSVQQKTEIINDKLLSYNNMDMTRVRYSILNEKCPESSGIKFKEIK